MTETSASDFLILAKALSSTTDKHMSICQFVNLLLLTLFFFCTIYFHVGFFSLFIFSYFLRMNNFHVQIFVYLFYLI